MQLFSRLSAIDQDSIIVALTFGAIVIIALLVSAVGGIV